MARLEADAKSVTGGGLPAVFSRHRSSSCSRPCSRVGKAEDWSSVKWDSKRERAEACGRMSCKRRDVEQCKLLVLYECAFPDGMGQRRLRWSFSPDVTERADLG